MTVEYNNDDEFVIKKYNNIQELTFKDNKQQIIKDMPKKTRRLHNYSDLPIESVLN